MLFAIIAAFAVATALFHFLFGAPEPDATPERFTVPLETAGNSTIRKLAAKGFVRNETAFRFALLLLGKDPADLKPGGYALSRGFGALKTARIITGEPVLQWIVIPEGLRKEEVFERLRPVFTWGEADAEAFLNSYQQMPSTLPEGMYFPDTYLIPLDEPAAAVGIRMIRRFNEKFEPYAKKLLAENIKNDTALKIASIVQREAAGKDDMPLIAGIIWNRLLKNMRLDIDATVQYARGRTTGGFWAPLKSENKSLESAYNTYRVKGLPPAPIANPGIAAIEAVIRPAKTECLFYLHDNDKRIHCAKTFDEHKENIRRYLTNGGA